VPTDVHTEVPTVVPTEIPTEAVIPTLTPLDTPTPTETPLSEATPEVTSEVTAEAAAELTPEATVDVTLPAPETPTPSLTTISTPPAVAPVVPEPGLTLISIDDFDGTISSNWIFPSNWMLFPTQRGLSLTLSNSTSQIQSVQTNLLNPVVQARFLIHAGAAHLGVRQGNNNGFTASLDRNGQVRLFQNNTLLQSTTLTPFAPGLWHTLRLSAMDDILRVTVDDVEIIVIQVSDPLLPGAVIVSGDSQGTSTLFVDDLFLWVASTEATAFSLPSASANLSMDSAEITANSLSLLLEAGSTNITFTQSLPDLDVFILDPDNPSIVTNLTNTPSLGEYAPALSPDGSKLAFVLSSADGSTAIYQIDATHDYDHKILLVNNAFSPVWSKDSQRLAFLSDRDGDVEIYIKEADGFIHQVTNNDYSDNYPTWSPAGDAIAYTTYLPTSKIEIAVVSSAGGTPILLTDNSAVDWYPNWAADNSQIVFISDRSGSYEIFLMNPDGSNQSPVIPLSGNKISPVWSPDSARIAFATFSFSGGNNPMYTMNRDGSNTTLLREHGVPQSWGLAFTQPPVCEPGEAAALASSSLDPSCEPQPSPSPFPSVTPVPAPTLSDYNVYVIDGNGVQLSVVEPTVFQAVSKTGRALLTISSLSSFDTYGVMTFRRVMVNDSSYFTSDSGDLVLGIVFYSQRPTIDCQTYNVGGNPVNIQEIPIEIRNAITANATYSGRDHQAVIGCSTGVIPILTEYTIVHELGHVFDGMATDDELTQKVTDTGKEKMEISDTPFFCNQTFPGYPVSCPPEVTWGKSHVVMGNLNTSQGFRWFRGDRGWGSATPISASQLTSFQQHYLPPAPYPASLLLEAHRETAADTFLNWVYRTIDPNGEIISTPVAPGSWAGFLNKSWSASDARWGVCNTSNGCNDYSYPGDARFSWMNTVMIELFQSNGW